MMQSLRRYYDDRTLKSQLVNSGKYFAAVSSGVLFMVFKLKGGMYVQGTQTFSAYYIAFIVMTFVTLIY